MGLRIDQDHSRFKEIVRGRIRDNLRKYISSGELIGRQGKDKISIPIPHIDIPRFRFGQKQTGGVGQGDGDIGDPVGSDGDAGKGKAGNEPSDHILEVDVTLDELLDILGKELELPKIEPKGASDIEDKKYRYTGIVRAGPRSLKHFRRSYKRTLIREMCAGTYDPDHPMIIPQHDDMRYRGQRVKPEPIAKAAIIYMMDVSGSMGDEQKELVRLTSFWIDRWIQKHYGRLETRYLIHDVKAREVDRDTFYHTKESGGTTISSAYELCAKMIDAEYSPLEWNIYPFHFSDGDNWSGDDNKKCGNILEQSILPAANMFCYGQVKASYGEGQFLKYLKPRFRKDNKVTWARIDKRDDIVEAIKKFLGKGR